MKTSGWGRYPIAGALVYAPRDLDALIARVAVGYAIARGNGRVYGNSAISKTNTIRHFNRISSFDDQTEQVVAGDRSRATSYVYGSAKPAFTEFLSGLCNRMAKKGVHVVTVLLGFVATKMTQSMDLSTKLTAVPREELQATTQNSDVIYVRKIWFVITMITRSIPDRIFKK